MRWALAATTLWIAACGFTGSGAGNHPDGGSGGGSGSGSGTTVDAPPDGSLAPGDWWDPSFGYRRSITVTSSHTTTKLVDFPVLVILPKAGFAWNHAAHDGSDLRVVADDGSPLAFAIDTISATETTWLWVKLTIDPVAQPTATRIWLYYGSASPVASAANSAAVFGAQTSVHHLGGGPGGLDDASGNGHTGTAENLVVAPKLPAGPALKYKPGIVGMGLDLDGSYGVMLAKEPDYRFTSALSASVWFTTDPFMSDWQALLTKGDHTWRISRDGGMGGVAFSTSKDGSDTNNDDLATTPTLGAITSGDAAWHYAGIAFDRPTKTFVFDGQILTDTWDEDVFSTQVAVTIADNLDRGQRRWKGAVDEVRIAATPRSADWLVNEYQTVTDPAFAVLGAEEAQ